MGNPDELKQEIKVLRQNLSGWSRTVRTEPPHHPDVCLSTNRRHPYPARDGGECHRSVCDSRSRIACLDR